jgi:hypothetical protein
MADSSSTVTVRAEMIDDVTPGAGKVKEAVKSMGEAAKTAGTGAAGAAASLGKELDGAGKHAEKLSGGTMTKLNKSLKDVAEHTTKVREGFLGLGETTTQKLTYPMQQLSYTLEFAVAGFIGLGIATYSSLQQANVQLTAFTGNATAGGAALKALYAMSDPTSLGALQSSFETLSLSGLSQGSSLKLLKALNSAGAISGNADANVPAAAAAISAIRANYGRIGSSQVASLQTLFPQLVPMLSKDLGFSSPEALRNALQTGYAPQMPANLIAQLEGTSQARTGRSTYEQTFAGKMGELHKSVDLMIRQLETPLIGVLNRDAVRVDNWAKGVEDRFGKLSGTLAKQWDSGNTAGFSHTLAILLGDPSAAKGIDTTIKLMESLGHVMTGVVFPAVETVAKVATPFFTFLADHATATKVLVSAFLGFEVLSKVIGPLQTTVKLIEAVKLAAGLGGAAGAVGQLARSFLGLGVAAKKGSAEAVAAERSVGSAAGAGAGGGGAAGVLGGVTSLLGFGLLAYGIDKLLGPAPPKKDQNWFTGPMSLTGMWNDTGGHAVHSVDNLWHGIFGGGGGSKSSMPTAQQVATNANISAQTSMGVSGRWGGAQIGTVNITIPGAGDPEKVANQIPKGINAQVQNYNKLAQRRSGKGG